MTTLTATQPAIDVDPGTSRRADLTEVWQPCLTTLVLVTAVAVSGMRGADYPAHLFRARLWTRAGATVWNFDWYGGHPTVTYGVLSPPIVALLGPFPVVAASALVSTYCFSRLTSDLLPSRATALANTLFGVLVVTNVVVGRVAFGLGFALALATLVVWQHRLDVAAVGVAALTSLASPVAGGFLALAALAFALARRHGGDRCRASAYAVAAAALAPIVVTNLAFGEPGHFPFRAGHLAASLVVLGALVAAARVPVVRLGGVFAAATAIALFLVPNPLGGNFVRLVQLVAVPLTVIAMDAFARPRRAAVAVVVVSAAVVWSLSPGVVAAIDWAGDPSVAADYHQPMIDEILARNDDGRPVGRVEIPFTLNHWEAHHVAAEVPYARGWDRQTDRVRHAALYEPDLTADAYRAWLRHHGVRWVAVPDVAIDGDGGGRREVELITSGALPWLREVWSDEHWQLYEVAGYSPIVDPPARLVEQDGDSIVIESARPGIVTVRYAPTGKMSISGGACVTVGDDGWIEADLPNPGRYELRATFLPRHRGCSEGATVARR